MKQKVYLAGGFKSNWQEIVINQLKDQFIFYNPRNHNLESPADYSVWDRHYVKQCDILFGFMELENPSGYGLAFEIGLAYGLGKTIILIDEKSLTNGEFERRFNLIAHSSSVVFYSLDIGIDYLKTFI